MFINLYYIFNCIYFYPVAKRSDCSFLVIYLSSAYSLKQLYLVTNPQMVQIFPMYSQPPSFQSKSLNTANRDAVNTFGEKISLCCPPFRMWESFSSVLKDYAARTSFIYVMWESYVGLLCTYVSQGLQNCFGASDLNVFSQTLTAM